MWDTEHATFYDPDNVKLNEYRGAVFQETSSAMAKTDQNCYELNTGCFAVYGFEYKPGYEEDGAYISWINNGSPSWRIGAGAFGKNPRVDISARPVPKEPMVS